MDIVVDGLDKVVSKFSRLSEDLQAQLRLALAKSLRDVKSSAEKHHNYSSDSGKLERQGLDFDIDRGQELSGRVYLATQAVSYAPFVHEGTKPHRITPRDKKCLRWIGGPYGYFFFSKEVFHPGTEADQFLYKAAAREESKVQENFREAVARALKE